MNQRSEVDLAEEAAILVNSGTVDEKGRSSRVIISMELGGPDITFVDGSSGYCPTENFWMRLLSASAT